MSDMIEVKVGDLTGLALDWAVGTAVGAYGLQIWNYTDGTCDVRFCEPEEEDSPQTLTLSPTSDWSQGGPLTQKYGVLLSPPKSMVHRNYGNFDERNGWYESGVWGATIFGNERKHRRRSFNHPDQPLVAAMRAIVQFELGDVVSVPAALVEGGTK